MSGLPGRLTYIKKSNGGVASARNAGIKASTGNYIATLDSDDLFEPHWMRVQVKYLEDHPDVALVYGDGKAFGNNTPEVPISTLSPSTGPVTFESLMHERCCVPTAGVLVRREAIFDIGLLDENLRWAEDFDLWLRIVKGGHRIAYHREPIFRYRRKHPVACRVNQLLCFDMPLVWWRKCSKKPIFLQRRDAPLKLPSNGLTPGSCFMTARWLLKQVISTRQRKSSRWRMRRCGSRG